MGKRLFPILIVTVSIAISLLSPNGVRSISAQPTLSEEATYFDDFSNYTPGLPPTGWLLRGADQVTPTVQEVGGTGSSYRLINFPEVPWQYWGRSLLKDGLTPDAPYTVTVKLNFQNKVADRAGLTIAWNDANGNQIEIQPNVYWNDIEFRETYNGPIQSNPVVNSVGTIPISAFTNYWLRVVVKDNRPGQGQLSVLWSTDGTNFKKVINATGLHDLRGLIGISTAGPHLPHVYFDDFSVSQMRPFSEPVPTPPVPELVTKTVIFKAPFSRYISSYFHSPVLSNSKEATCRGLSGFPKIQTDKSTGLIGYSGFAWGGFCSNYNFFSANKSPAQQATSESLLGGIFTVPVSGTYSISADIELHGNGTATAGAGAFDIIQSLVPGKVGEVLGVVSLLDLTNPANLFPSAASAENTLTLLVGNTDSSHSNSNGFRNLAVDYVLHKDQDEVFNGTQTLTMTVHLSAGQKIMLLSGLKTNIKAWGNATAVVKPLNSKLNKIVVQLVSQ